MDVRRRGRTDTGSRTGPQAGAATAPRRPRIAGPDPRPQAVARGPRRCLRPRRGPAGGAARVWGEGVASRRQLPQDTGLGSSPAARTCTQSRATLARSLFCAQDRPPCRSAGTDRESSRGPGSNDEAARLPRSGVSRVANWARTLPLAAQGPIATRAGRARGPMAARRCGQRSRDLQRAPVPPARRMRGLAKRPRWCRIAHLLLTLRVEVAIEKHARPITQLRRDRRHEFVHIVSLHAKHVRRKIGGDTEGLDDAASRAK